MGAYDDDFAALGDAVIDAFGQSITITRPATGSYDHTTRSETLAPSLTATVNADKQQTRRGAMAMGGGGKAGLEEVVFNIAVADIAATAIVAPQEGDFISDAGVTRRICGVHVQVGGKMYQVVCRDEKKGG